MSEQGKIDDQILAVFLIPPAVVGSGPRPWPSSELSRYFDRLLVNGFFHDPLTGRIDQTMARNALAMLGGSASGDDR